MAQNFKHNKKRNTGLIYEFLIRRLSQSMLDGNNEGQRSTLGIVKKYYDSELGSLSEERELFDVIKNSRGISESVARQIIQEVQKHARKFDHQKLDIKKSNLIKEINYTFGKSFWDEHRIPDYRVLASIQMVIDSSRGDATLTESVSKIQLEEGLIQYMMTKPGKMMVETQQSEIDQMVMKMVAKRFEEKYAKTLNKSQKKLLEKYIRFQVTNDIVPISEAVISEFKRIHETISSARTMKEFSDDKVMSDKLNEAFTKLTAAGALSLDKQVEELMLFQKLVEEIETNE